MNTKPEQETSSSLITGHPDDLQKWIDIYQTRCRARGLSVRTLEFYQNKLRSFARYCFKHGVLNMKQIYPDHIRGYLMELESRGYRPGGVACHFQALRAFMNWYENESANEDWRNPMRKVRKTFVPAEPLDPVSSETIRALLGTCTRAQLNDVRDRSSMLFLLDTGLRLSEFLTLDRGDVDPATGTVRVRAVNESRARLAYLGDRSRKTLLAYLQFRTDRDPALWVNGRGERMKGSGLRMMLRRRAERVHMPIPSPAGFRRAFAARRRQAGMDILTLSRMMGHASLNPLSRCLRMIEEDLEDAAGSSSAMEGDS